MTTLPVRRLGSTGIVTDVFPGDLENPAAFSGGVNIRFSSGRVSRAPVFRSVIDLDHEPGHLLAIPPSASGIEEIVSVAQDYGSIKRVNGAILEDLTPPAHSAVAGDQVITSAFLGGVAYVNRPTHDPLCKRTSDGTFVTLPNWPTGDRCVSLRPYKDQLIALGVTKSGAYYPTMVRWSDFAFFGDVPGTWDPADTTASAGENIINEMRHPIVDGLALRDSFVLYCTSSVWQMQYVGGNDIYVFRKLLDDRGVVNQNCVAQVGGLHYVFDRTDIYVHDGVSERSICDERTRRFIFDALDFSKVHLCFVQHDPKLSEVRFGYVSNDRFIGFENATTGCNRQAVYNYATDTWSFYDVPNLVGGSRAAILGGDNWDDDLVVEWGQTGGLWASNEGDEDRHTLVASRADAGMGLTASRIYGQDLINGGRLPQPIHPETLKPAMAERVGIDLDGYGKRLTQHINVQAIWPQVAMDSWEDCSWQFGGTNFVTLSPEWGPEHTFDPSTETRIDLNESGKYIAYRFICRGDQDFDLHAFDIQLLIRGRR